MSIATVEQVEQVEVEGQESPATAEELDALLAEVAVEAEEADQDDQGEPQEDAPIVKVCQANHRLTEADVYRPDPNKGTAICKICRRERQKESRERVMDRKRAGQPTSPLAQAREQVEDLKIYMRDILAQVDGKKRASDKNTAEIVRLANAALAGETP